jgi:hypothetical protein
VHWSVWLLREMAATSPLADDGAEAVLDALEGSGAGVGALRA